MQYDPVKRSLGKVFNQTPVLRILFYKLLDLLLLRTWHLKKEIRKWARQKNDSISILDAGSGFGQYVYYLSCINKQWTIKGVDVKDEQVEDCNNFFKKINKPSVRFEIADLTTFSEENKYNLILSIDVMEHIEEDVCVFKNLHKSLKNQGLLLISTPSDQGGSDVHHEDEHSFISEHVRDGYNILDIENKLKDAGFSKIEVYYTYGCPGNISWYLSMKYPIQLLNFSKIFFIILPFYYLLTYPFSLILNFLDVTLKHNKGTGLLVKAWK